MEGPGLKAEILAVLFAAGRPVRLKELKALGHPEEALLRALKALEKDLEAGHLAWPWSGWRGGGGFWCTKRCSRRWKGSSNPPRPASPRRPWRSWPSSPTTSVARAELEAMRGKSVEGVLESLLERGLIRVVGEKEAPGRPKLYGTTERFLEVFGLESLEDLPPLEEGPPLLLRG